MYNAFYYRAGKPQYALDGKGTGARLNGGRFNVKGESALYLASHPYLALSETGFPSASKGIMLVTWRLNLLGLRLADMTQLEGRVDAGVDYDHLGAGWVRGLDNGDSKPHQVAVKIKAAGYDGMMYPSFTTNDLSNVPREAHNLVLWSWKEKHVWLDDMGGDIIAALNKASR